MDRLTPRENTQRGIDTRRRFLMVTALRADEVARQVHGRVAGEEGAGR